MLESFLSRELPLIVGIGASAGGVEALQALFRDMPEQTPFAFVVVTHLARGHESALPEILGRCTRLPVMAARDGETVAANHVYVIASDTVLTIERGCLRVRSHNGRERERHTIDLFFTALAEDASERAIAVILSGLGSDGTLGAKAIKEKGGLTVAQKSDHSAPRHPEMPESAIASGFIDLQLPIETIGAKLAEYAAGFGSIHADGQPRGRRDHIDGARQAICNILYDQLGHNFIGYKQRTVLRRIERRMQVLELTDIDEYVEHLRRDRGEAIQLFRDMLIGVTAFFRDAEAFDALAAMALPQLLAGIQPTDTLRVWVPGCSTGEEVYSIVILLLEQMERLPARPNIQCFATDIDEAAIAVARAARYPAAMLRDVEPRLVNRYFSSDGAIYTVAKAVRDQCIFSSHSVIRDPPFSRVDLISCRNLLIYFDTRLQSQLVPVFHYALRPGGFLFLGNSENLTHHSEFFAPVDKPHRIFQRRDDGGRHHGFPLMLPGGGHGLLPPPPFVRNIERVPLRQSIEQRVLERFAPAHVVVNRGGDIVHYSPHTSKYLENAAGVPSRQLTAMVRRGARLGLRSALNEAADHRRAAVRRGLAIEVDDEVQTIDLTVEPLPEFDGELLYLVVFADVGQGQGAGEAAAVVPEQRADVDRLDQELRDTRDRLQSMVEEYETALEELKSANEELVSTNEELQSTNEELETSREETQSVNEELNTVNSELQRKVEELDRVNDDLRSLFDSSPIGTVFLDRHLVIRTFTPAITTIFNLIPADRGRPLTDFANELEGADLHQEIAAVLHSGAGRERRVARRGGRGHYQMRILPDTSASSAGGVLVSFVDITAAVAIEEHQRQLGDAAVTMLEQATHLVEPDGAAAAAAPHRLHDRLQRLAALYRTLLQGTRPGTLPGTLPVPLPGIELRQLVGGRINGVEPHSAAAGPPAVLRPKAALALGLALDEMGAPECGGDGAAPQPRRLHVAWWVEEPGAPNERLVVEAHAADAPGAASAGSWLEAWLRHAIGATVTSECTAAGMQLRVAIPTSGGTVVLS